MSIARKMTGSALCVAAALIVANAALAATKPTPVPHAPRAPQAQQQAASPDAIFAKWDTDKNNALSLEEFKAGWQELQGAAVLRTLHGNFVAMDADKSNCLESAEYAKLELIKKAGKTAPAMSTFDTDKNGCLDFKEYVGMVNTMVKKK
jgi:Ca2+-binding EF-hand superfamily protein